MIPALRIISLVPSQTELLYDLGLDAEVVGITKFCTHPPGWLKHKPRIGGTKNIHPEMIRALKPDLILANKEENVKEQVESLRDLCPVYVSDIADLSGALDMIREIGALTGREARAAELAGDIQGEFERYAAALPVPRPGSQAASKRLPCTYFIWRNPWMVAGGDTFIHDLLERAGFENVFQNRRRYPSIDRQTLAASGCRLVLLSSEPYPFREKHIAEIREVLPEARVRLVDGEMFSWYGSRLRYAPGYFRALRQELERHPYF